jgi:hypothetical protein
MFGGKESAAVLGASTNLLAIALAIPAGAQDRKQAAVSASSGFEEIVVTARAVKCAGRPFRSR